MAILMHHCTGKCLNDCMLFYLFKGRGGEGRGGSILGSKWFDAFPAPRGRAGRLYAGGTLAAECVCTLGRRAEME